MEVSQIAQLDTHVIIGGGKAEAFQIAQSAEFFTVLSSTLYRDKVRAVVREVTCNAWDAHIIAGKTKTPVSITVTDEELVIADVGPGIPHEKIHAVYCVYGSSTKASDGTQTGGFGLGSKAPFAYTDHFTVTNCHAGIKSVYAISRGGAETDGKPDFRCMMSIPTEESGLTVSIPIANGKDKADFTKNINAVVKQGGILATLNGEAIDTPDYSKARERGFCLLPKAYNLNEARVYVLYGAVLYPLQTVDAELTSLARKIGNYFSHDWTPVLCAPANSIGVTPSRESLSYTPATMKTLMEISERFLRRIGNEQRRQAIPLFRSILMKSEDPFKRLEFACPQSVIPPIPASAGSAVTSLEHMGMVAAATRIRSLVPNAHKMAMLHYATKNKDLRRAFRRCAYTRGAVPEKHKIDTRLFLRLAQKSSLLSNLFYATIFNYGTEKPALARAHLPCLGRLEFKKQLVVAYNQRDAIAALTTLKATLVESKALAYGARIGVGVIILKGSQASKLPMIRELATQYSIDLTEIERSTAQKRVKKTPVAAKFHSLEHVSYEGYLVQEPTLETAKYFVRAYQADGEMYVSSYIAENAKLLRQVFGVIAVARDNRDEDKLKLSNARDIIDQIGDEFEAKMGEPEFQFAYAALTWRFIKAQRQHKMAWSLASLMSQWLPVAIEFAPIKMKASAKLDCAWRLAKLFYTANSGLNRHTKRRPATANQARRFRELHEKASLESDVYTKLVRISEEEIDRRFGPGSRLLVYSTANTLEEVQAYIETARFLEKRTARKAKITSKASGKTALNSKEAA